MMSKRTHSSGSDPSTLSPSASLSFPAQPTGRSEPLPHRVGVTSRYDGGGRRTSCTGPGLNRPTGPPLLENADGAHQQEAASMSRRPGKRGEVGRGS